jgi:hypothetical protein
MSPRPVNLPIAVELSDIDQSIVVAGGVTIVSFPHVARNFRRSSTSGLGVERPSSAAGILRFSQNE